MRTDTTKQERLHLRLDAKAKDRLEKAAAFLRKSTSDFVLTYALNAADEVIASHEHQTLSDQDWDLFYEALVTPPEPNKKLKQAMQKHRQSKR